VFAASDPNVLVAFGAGILSFLSPCVLPLVPGYLSLMSGLSASDVDGRRVHMLRATLLFVAGFTVVFVALGAAASGIGELLLDHQRGLNQIAGVIVIVMGVVVAGILTPDLLQRERRLHVSPAALGGWAPPVMGMAFAFGWSPCIGPVLAGVLTLASTEATVWRGVVLLAAYSLGLGVPFVVSGLAFARLSGVFGWVKRHFRVINVVSGSMLVAFGVLLVLDRVFWLSLIIQRAMERVGLDSLSRI
jgi:cytochrome c-type biogenesis protein